MENEVSETHHVSGGEICLFSFVPRIITLSCFQLSFGGVMGTLGSEFS
jgi:hypothetical protein